MLLTETNVIDMEKLSKIIEEFALAADFGSVLVDIHGKQISKLHNFSPFCLEMRQNPKFKDRCQKCDAFGGLEASKNGKPHIYRCHAGLTDISFPLIQQNQLIGFGLFGQVKVSDIKENQFNRIHPEITNWKDYPNLRQTRTKIKIVTTKQLTAAASLFETIANFHDIGDDNRNQIQFTVKKNHTKKQASQSSSNHQEISKAMNYINKNLSRNITLEEVSDYVFLSHYYFSRLFKKELGVSFVTYLNKQRIKQAKILLTQTDLSIQKIAYQVGYTQPSYFCKLFKKETGTTPAGYRKKIIL